MKSIALITCCLLGSGCGSGNWSNDDLAFLNALNAIPTKELRAKIPTGTSGGLSGEGTRRDALTDPVLGARSQIYVGAKDASGNFNNLLLTLLGIVDNVRGLTPTSRAPGSRTWGPVNDPQNPGFEVKLVLTKGEDGNFGYAIQQRRKDGGEFFSSVSGAFKPTTTLKKGTGALTIHAAVIAAQLPSATWAEPLEKIEMAYVTDAFPITVLMKFTGKAGMPLTALDYGYQENEDKSGGLGFKTRSTDPNLSEVDIGTAWLASGAGYGVLTVIAGGYAGATWFECWDAAFNLVYARQSWPGGLTVGELASCVTVPNFPRP